MKDYLILPKILAKIINFFFPLSDHLWVLFPDVFMVVTSEVAVDVIKHAFITKFNDITADVRTEPGVLSFSHHRDFAWEHVWYYMGYLAFFFFLYWIIFLSIFQVYSEYRASLAFDLVSSRQKNVSNCLVFSHCHHYTYINSVEPTQLINSVLSSAVIYARLSLCRLVLTTVTQWPGGWASSPCHWLFW